MEQGAKFRSNLPTTRYYLTTARPAFCTSSLLECERGTRLIFSVPTSRVSGPRSSSTEIASIGFSSSSERMSSGWSSTVRKRSQRTDAKFVFRGRQWPLVDSAIS